ncbi:MAG: hypothetical protein LWW94_11625 [Candidatus Desulfofervidaceae bacterium]|nr:hypothetical protein [Candidatus Desulfofervidaceae bacterium]
MNLLSIHKAERKERFFPFYLVLAEKKEHPRYQESLYIVNYFLGNALIHTKEDEEFYQVLKKAYRKGKNRVKQKVIKTPLPLQDYLKVVYDLRKMD